MNSKLGIDSKESKWKNLEIEAILRGKEHSPNMNKQEEWLTFKKCLTEKFIKLFQWIAVKG